MLSNGKDQVARPLRCSPRFMEQIDGADVRGGGIGRAAARGKRNR
jgi:hypothetical protein